MKFQQTSRIDGKSIVVTLIDGQRKQEIPMEIWTATGPLYGNPNERIAAQNAAKGIVDAALAQNPEAKKFGEWMQKNGMKVRI